MSEAFDLNGVSKDYFRLIDHLDKYKVYTKFNHWIYNYQGSRLEGVKSMEGLFFETNEYIENRFWFLFQN